MKVDRTRFLLLTTALSAATVVGGVATGCTVNNTDKATPAPVTEGCTGASCDGGNGDAYYSDAGDGGDGGACLDDDGVAPTCVNASASCATVCDHYIHGYKKGVAREITDCIFKLPTCDNAATEIANCVQTALGKACSDTTATSYCSPIVESCVGDGGDAGTGALNLTECTDLATGLNSTGRATFTSCVTEGTAAYCKADPASCIDLLE